MLTTVLEVAACACLLAGAFLLAGVGGLFIGASVVLFGASYALSRGSA